MRPGRLKQVLLAAGWEVEVGKLLQQSGQKRVVAWVRVGRSGWIRAVFWGGIDRMVVVCGGGAGGG